MESLPSQIPDALRDKFTALEEEIDQILTQAEAVQQTDISGRVSFTYESTAPRDLLTEDERAQSICFVTRYEALPVSEQLRIVAYGDRYYIGNLDYLRHVLNEYRAIVQNKRDSVYYRRIHQFCHGKLVNRNTSNDLVITAEHESEGDITSTFARYLDEQCRSIAVVLRKSEFSYVYNGVLQHSDHSYTRRFLEDYHSGRINYIFVKHAQLLGYIKECLLWHYRLLNALTFPKLGPL